MNYALSVPMAPEKKVGFFSPIYFHEPNHPQESCAWLGRAVEWYFDIGQKSYRILPNTLADRSIPIAKSLQRQISVSQISSIALKLLSYITILPPIVMAVGKFIYRRSNSFTIQKQLSAPVLQHQLDFAGTVLKKAPPKLSFSSPTEFMESATWVSSSQAVVAHFQKSLHKSAVFLTPTEGEAFHRAIEHVRQQLDNCGSIVNANAALIAREIQGIQKQMIDRLSSVDGAEKSRLAERMWKDLLCLDGFIRQFHQKLQFVRIENNWQTEKGQRLYDEAAISLIRSLVVPKGIINLGATCFMNASLQAILANPEFRSRLKNPHPPVYEDLEKQLQSKLSSTGFSSEALHLFQVWKNLPAQDLSKRARWLAIPKLLTQLQEASHKAPDWQKLKEAFPEELALLVGDFGHPNLERAQQILSTIRAPFVDFSRYKSIIETLREFVAVYENPSSSPSSLEALANRLRTLFFEAGCMDGSMYDQQDAAAILEYVLDAISYRFPLAVQYQATLQENGASVLFQSRETLPYQLLQVSTKRASLQQLFDDELSQQHVDPNNSWKATHPITKKETSISKWTESRCIEGEPPQFLQIHLKRFQHDAFGITKISDDVDVGNCQVDLSRYFHKPEGAIKYKIASGIIHQGSFGGGHYFTIAEKAGTWFQCNDSSIFEEPKPKQKLKQAYILFLERISV